MASHSTSRAGKATVEALSVLFGLLSTITLHKPTEGNLSPIYPMSLKTLCGQAIARLCEPLQGSPYKTKCLRFALAFKRRPIIPPGVCVISHYKPFQNGHVTKNWHCGKVTSQVRRTLTRSDDQPTQWTVPTGKPI